MAFTSNSDLYLAVLDTGFNRVVGHVFRQRPSLVNYATAGVIASPSLACNPVLAHPVVIARGNPLFTEIPSVPVLGTAFVVDAVAQLTSAQLDLHPIAQIAPPPEVASLIAANTFLAQATVHAGLSCPFRDPQSQPSRPTGRDRGTISLPGRMNCFELSAFLAGAMDFVGPAGAQHLKGKLLGLELVDLSPAGLESALECYLSLVIRLGILPQVAVPTIRNTQTILGSTLLTIEPTTTVPVNPLIEQDQLKVFLDANIVPAPGSGGGGGGGGSGHDSSGGLPRPRVRSGPFDVVAAASEPTVRELVEQLLSSFKFEKSGGGSVGPFTANYSVRAHLEGGSVDLRNDGTILVKEVDIKWDQLRVCLGIDIPEICIGGFCIIPTPFGCALEAPRICAFSPNPDLEICLDVGGLLTSEVSMAVRPLTKYRVDPGRTSGMNDWDCLDAGIPNRWQVMVDPEWVDVDLIDVADTVGDLLDAAIDAALDGVLGGLPGWAKDLIKAILGPLVDVVRAILDLGDDVQEWLSDLLGTSLGIFDALAGVLADRLANDTPLLELDDPHPLLPGDAGRIPVLIPVEFLGVRVVDEELIVEGDIGGV
jgi:hypothetical protein